MEFTKDSLEAFDAHGEKLMEEAAQRQTDAIAKLLSDLEKPEERS